MRRIVNPQFSITLAHLSNPTTIDSLAQALNGYLQNVFVTLPALDASATATLNVKDSFGNVLYTKTGLVGGQTTNCVPTAQIAVANPLFEIVTSASQTSDKNITFTPYVDVLE